MQARSVILKGYNINKIRLAIESVILVGKSYNDIFAVGRVIAVGQRNGALIINKVIKGFLGLCLVLLPLVCSASPTSTQYRGEGPDYLDRVS